MSLDPKKEPVPVEPGIHYFMGGIYVDETHESSLRGLYAAGECACQYHGANRLGGNSLLGAVYGGKRAAEALARQSGETPAYHTQLDTVAGDASDAVLSAEIGAILRKSLGIVREEAGIEEGLRELDKLRKRIGRDRGRDADRIVQRGRERLRLAEAMLCSAKARRESRGAHYRRDYPERSAAYQKTTVACYDREEIVIRFEEIPGFRQLNSYF